MDFEKGDWVVFKKKYKYGDAVVGNISNRVMIVIKEM